ncbi:MAG TPA: alpha/beta hydrolase [Mycobacteriales bacterium]|nr:alpha/beta hydrolase [Mycobacteriales bacterium]
MRVLADRLTEETAIPRLACVLLATLTAVTAVAGCTSTSSAPLVQPARSSSSGASTPAALAPFYDQKLIWHGCADGLRCTKLTVPLDYRRPAGRTLRIAVIEEKSSGTPQGSLIVNPGGPGASGVQFVEEAGDLFKPLMSHLDLVSFDPRGVGASDPVRCLTGPQLDAYVNLDPDPTTAAQRAATIRQSREFADACYAKNGDYLEHVGTIDEARDMDVLRAALGDAKLTYYGASYGTYLGAKYAQLFPTHIRAMVLDGALDPAESATASNLVQAKGFETDLDDFLAYCVGQGKCPFGSSESAAMGWIDDLIARLTAHPLTSDGRLVGAGELFEGLAAGLYSTSDWPQLIDMLTAANSGNGAGVLLFADSLTGRNSNGTYSNLVESNLAINCIDRPSPTSVSAYERAAAKFEKVAPHFGAAIEYGSLPCAFWKVPPVEKPHPVHAVGAPPILVIGTTRDPATPFVWAKALAGQLSSGVLLTHDGDGHTAYVDKDSCVDSVVAKYVLDLVPPKPGTVCK